MAVFINKKWGFRHLSPISDQKTKEFSFGKGVSVLRKSSFLMKNICLNTKTMVFNVKRNIHSLFEIENYLTKYEWNLLDTLTSSFWMVYEWCKLITNWAIIVTQTVWRSILWFENLLSSSKKEPKYFMILSMLLVSLSLSQFSTYKVATHTI